MTWKRWGALAAALVLASGAAACGEQHHAQMRAIGLVTPGPHNDLDWTRQSRDAFTSIAEARHLSGSIAGRVDAARAGAAVEQLAREGADLVLADEPSYAAAAANAAERTGTPVLVWGDRAAMRPGLVGDVEIEAAEGGYVAGALTAHATGIKSLAVLVLDDGTDWDAANWNRMAGGFLAGARRTAPEAKLFVEWVGGADGADSEEVQLAAERFLDAGVQTIFSLGGRSALGALRAVDRMTGEQEFSGVIGDRATLNHGNDIVTSVVYDFRGLFERAIADVRAGTFGERPYTLSFANGGFRLLRTGRTPQDAYDAGLAAARDVRDGKVTLPETPSRAAVRALLHEAPGTSEGH